MGKLRVIGIVGGIGSGKSTVARMFGRLGAIVVDADEICHRLLFDRGVKAKVRKAFGGAVFNAGGEVDRRALGRAAFENAGKLKRLTGILHPPVHREIRAVVRGARKGGKVPAVALDVALLLESKMDKMCDALVFVDASPKIRAARVRKDRNWSPGEIAKRAKFQKAINKKIKMADYVINNSLTKRDTFDQVRHVWRELCHEEE